MSMRVWCLAGAVMAMVSCTDTKEADDDLSIDVPSSDDAGGGSEGGDEGGGAGGDEGGDEGGGEGGGDEGGSGTTGPDPDPDPEPCETLVVEGYPSAGMRDVSVLSTFEASLDAPLGDENLRVLDASGREVPGRLRRTDRDRLLTFYPEDPLQPSTEHTVVVEVCGGTVAADWSVTTSDRGAPLTCDPVGRAYVMNLDEARFVAPDPSVAPLLFELFESSSLVVSVVATSDDEATLRLGVGDATAPVACAPTADLSGTFADPVAAVSVPTVPALIDGVAVDLLHDASLDTVLAADCSDMEVYRLAGTLDMRSLTPALADLVGTEDADEICALVATFGLTCSACPSDGEAYCLDLEVTEMTAQDVSYTLDARSAEDVADDPTCTDASGCSHMSRAPWAWGLATLGLLGLVARRRGAG